MEKPDSCPECGSARLTSGEIEVTAHLVQTLDKRGEVVTGAPKFRLDMRVDAWHCEDCDHDEIDKKRVEKEITAKTEELMQQYFAERAAAAALAELN